MLRIVREYYEGNARILVLEGDRERLYMIDHYELLEKDPRCMKMVELGDAKLCYIDLGGGCEALALIIGDRREIISLRLITSIDRDLCIASPERARKHCLDMLSHFRRTESSDP